MLGSPYAQLEDIEKLEEAYNQGRYYYLRQRDLDRLSGPYPWQYNRHGYGPYGWYSPFWRPPVW